VSLRERWREAAVGRKWFRCGAISIAVSPEGRAKLSSALALSSSSFFVRAHESEVPLLLAAPEP